MPAPLSAHCTRSSFYQAHGLPGDGELLIGGNHHDRSAALGRGDRDVLAPLPVGLLIQLHAQVAQVFADRGAHQRRVLDRKSVV